MIANLGSKAWALESKGNYRRGQFTITRQADADGRAVYVVRFAGRVIDRAATLADAKKCCE